MSVHPQNPPAYPGAPTMGVQAPCTTQPSTVMMTPAGLTPADIHSPPTVMQQHVKPPSTTAAYVVSCLVFWFCCFFAGAVAFYYAHLGSKDIERAEYEAAKKKIYISYRISYIGLSIVGSIYCLSVISSIVFVRPVDYDY